MLEIKRSRLSRLRKNPHMSHAARRLRGVVIAVVVLIVLVAIAGLVYTWYMGQQPLPETAQPRPAAPVQTPKVPERTISQEAPVGVSLTTLTTPLKAPSNAMISIKTNPGAACKIDVKYNNVSAQDTGLVPKIADDFGMVQWTWTVPLGTPVGKWPAEITCANQKMSGYYKATVEIVEQLP